MGVASYNIFLPIFFKHLRTLNLGSTYHLPLQHCIEHINRRPFTNNSYPHISPLTYLLVMKLLKCNIVTNWTCFGKIIKGKYFFFFFWGDRSSVASKVRKEVAYRLKSTSIKTPTLVVSLTHVNYGPSIVPTWTSGNDGHNCHSQLAFFIF